MDITLAQVVSWLIVGALAGTVVGRVAKGSKTGYGIWKNLGIGLVGGAIGGVLFSIFGIRFLEDVSISANDILAALVGALIFLAVLAIVRKKNAKPTA